MKRWGLLPFLLMVWAAILLVEVFVYEKDTEIISYSQFLSEINVKKIDQVTIGEEKIEGERREAITGQPKRVSAYRVEDPALLQKLEKAGVKYGGLPQSRFWSSFFTWLIPIGLLILFWLLMVGRFERFSGGNPLLSLGKAKAKIYIEKGLKTRFSEVAGIDEVKAELQEVVQFLKNPAQYSRLGGRMPKGILLVGSPGTGKTMLARAVAGEAGVPFFSINGSEFVELFVGLGAARVRDLFEQARGQAPCIIFIDELDALGKARGLSAITGSASDEKEQTLNQLLAELDGFDASVGVIILAATNRPEVLDPALLRAGRFDRQILVDKPDRKGRSAILTVHLKKIHTSREVDSEMIASLTAGFSGADLANLVNEAALIATRRGAREVEPHDFTEAIERTVAGLERRSRIISPAEKRRVAYHEMGHAILGLALGQSEAIHKVSVIPRGITALGYTFRRPTEDRYLMNRKELEAKLAMLLGGRASEMIFFDDISTGAADDLDKATEIARAMVTRYGMSDHLGLITFEREQAPLLGSTMGVRSVQYSEETARVIDLEVKGFVERALEQALQVLRHYHNIVVEGAELLLQHETLDEQILKKLWEKRTGAKLLRIQAE